MSDLIINWRFGRWFFQVTRPSSWRYTRGLPATLWRVPAPRPSSEPLCAFYQGGGYFLIALIVLAALVGWVAS